MSKNQNSLYPEDWKTVARKDWNRIKRNLTEDDPEAAGFFLQQALEKYLKAFLLERGWELRKIHTLYTLLDDAVQHNPSLESFRELCRQVSGYYFVERYPQLTSLELTCKDIEKNLEEAGKFIKTMFPQEDLNKDL